MNKLIYDSTSYGQKVIFSTAEELTGWLDKKPSGILFAVDKHAATVYSVFKGATKEPWAMSSSDKSFLLTFSKLVNEFDLYFIDNHQMIHLIETCEN